MISITELHAAWTSIQPKAGQNIGRRADNTHPLDFFITYDENSNMQLMLLSNELPALPVSSQEIIVRSSHRADGRYAICFSLADDSLCDQFVSLCWDIMNFTYTALSQKSGIISAIKRFILWQKLFAEKKNKKLSDDEIKGLIGELLVLSKIILPKYDSYTAVSGWIGSIGADRDFEFTDTWYETKAVSLSKNTVSISSLDQLDIDRDGYLVVVRLEKVSLHTPSSFTLNSLVEEIQAGLTDSEASDTFEARLLSYRYDASDERAEEAYVFHKAEIFKIDNAFPRIRRSEMHTAIANVKYELNIPALQAWRED